MTTAIGPQGPNYTTTRPPADPQASAGTDTWFKNCSRAGAKDGTYATADFFNVLIAQIRQAIRLSGVLLDNGSDNMLYDAIVSICDSEITSHVNLNHVVFDNVDDTSIANGAVHLTRDTSSQEGGLRLRGISGGTGGGRVDFYSYDLTQRRASIRSNSAATQLIIESQVSPFDMLPTERAHFDLANGDLNLKKLALANIASGDVAQAIINLAASIGGGGGGGGGTTYAQYANYVYRSAGSTSISIPAWAKLARVRVRAGGGAGGNGQNGAAAGGGGGGELREFWCIVGSSQPIVPSTTVSINVGAGGAVSGSGGGNGGNGGSSSFGAVVAAVGGTGGQGSNTTSQFMPGGAGGTGGSGGVGFQGSTGGTGAPYMGGIGGASPMGGSVSAGQLTVNASGSGVIPGVAGDNPGCGGSGSAAGYGATPVGGAGAAGEVLVDLWG